MLKPACPNNWIVESCREPFGIPSRSVFSAIVSVVSGVARYASEALSVR